MRLATSYSSSMPCSMALSFSLTFSGGYGVGGTGQVGSVEAAEDLVDVLVGLVDAVAVDLGGGVEGAGELFPVANVVWGEWLGRGDYR